MQNLFGLKKNKESLIRKYSLDHDYEIGYQLFHGFLKGSFYNYLLGQLSSADYLSELDSLQGLEMSIKYDRLLIPFIKRFIHFYELGDIASSEKDGSNYAIVFGDISIDELISAFYEELQKVEYYMHTPEEMQAELDAFKEVYASWIEEKFRTRDDVPEIIIDEYYRFINELYKTIDYYIKDIVYEEDFFTGFVKTNINKEECFEIYDYIFRFIQGYRLGHCNCDANGVVRLYFNKDLQDIYDACLMEMQRLKYFLDEAHQGIHR